MTDPIYTIRDLSVHFQDNAVVNNVSFDLHSGRALALVGESGSGKTITSRALLGLVPDPGIVSTAELTFNDRDLRQLSERDWRKIRGQRVGIVAQDALVSLDGLRRVEQEVGEVLQVQSNRTGKRLNKEQVRQRVVEELARVAIPDPANRAKQYPHELSGGLRQRALIASATIAQPEVIIADEPTTALDVSVAAEILTLLGELKKNGSALLLVSHDLAVVSQVADDVAVMKDGVIVETGAVDQVLGNPQHEYTKRLLAAVPALHPRGTRLSKGKPLTFESKRWDSYRTQQNQVQLRQDNGADTGASQRIPLVKVDSVAKSFKRPDGTQLHAVNDVSLQLHSGSTVGIVGESGSGKTTLGRIILGLETPDTGSVELAGKPWSGIAERHRRTRRGLLQAVYQDPLSSFDPRKNVGSLLFEALSVAGVARKDRRENAVELVENVGLTADVLRRSPITLSGGQRQRIAIARALTRNPKVLVCDEPVSALDVSVQAQVLDLFSDIKEKLGLSLLFISHDLSVVQHICDEVLVMKSGAVVERGKAETVFRDPQHEYTRELVHAIPQVFNSSVNTIGKD